VLGSYTFVGNLARLIKSVAYLMTSPYRSARGVPKLRVEGMPSATIRFEDGQRSSARLQTISVTGGLLRVLKPFSPGAIVELMFSKHVGPVLAMAELLNPCSVAPIGLQRFRFIAIDNAGLRKLRAAMAPSRRRQ
jgi:hypothetical protein